MALLPAVFRSVFTGIESPPPSDAGVQADHREARRAKTAVTGGLSESLWTAAGGGPILTVMVLPRLLIVLVLAAFAAGAPVPAGAAALAIAGLAGEMTGHHGHEMQGCAECPDSAASGERACDLPLPCCLPSTAVLSDQIAPPRDAAEGHASALPVSRGRLSDPPNPSPPRSVALS